MRSTGGRSRRRQDPPPFPPLSSRSPLSPRSPRSPLSSAERAVFFISFPSSFTLIFIFQTLTFLRPYGALFEAASSRGGACPTDRHPSREGERGRSRLACRSF